MQVTDFKRFIFENKIKQSFLAQYLGVSEGYISSVVSGRKELSEENFSKVLNNPYGWNTSMLTSGIGLSILEHIHEERQAEQDLPSMIKSAVESVLSKRAEDAHVSYLKEQIADKDRLIRELYDEVSMLKAKLELARKGETALGATGSSDADAV